MKCSAVKIIMTGRAQKEVLSKLKSYGTRLSRPVFPKLLYYKRMFSIGPHGKEIEHGDGMVLHFVQNIEPHIDEYIEANLNDDTPILIGPISFLSPGNWSIDWEKGKFLLVQLAPHEMQLSES